MMFFFLIGLPFHLNFRKDFLGNYLAILSTNNLHVVLVHAKQIRIWEAVDPVQLTEAVQLKAAKDFAE